MSIKFGILQQVIGSSKKTITIDYTEIPSSVTDFPLVLKETNFDTEDFSGTEADLRFYDSSDNLLSHEIVNFGSTNTEIWVKTDLSSSVNTVIQYDFSGEGTIDSTDVWTNDYSFVTHCNDIGDDTLYDSVNGVYSGVISNILYYTSNSQTKWGSAAKVSSGTGGLFSYLSKYNDAYTTKELTVQFFGFMIDDNNSYIMSRGGNYYSIIFGYVNDKFEYYNSPRLQLNDTFTNNSFGQVAFSFNFTDNSGYRIYNNDSNVVSNSGTIVSGTQGINILSIGNGQEYAGYTDELRISSTTRSTDWFSIEYTMMMNHSDLFV